MLVLEKNLQIGNWLGPHRSTPCHDSSGWSPWSLPLDKHTSPCRKLGPGCILTWAWQMVTWIRNTCATYHCQKVVDNTHPPTPSSIPTGTDCRFIGCVYVGGGAMWQFAWLEVMSSNWWQFQKAFFLLVHSFANSSATFHLFSAPYGESFIRLFVCMCILVCAPV